MNVLFATYILIGWLNGYRSGGVIEIEFSSKETCEIAKSAYVKNHGMLLDDDRWVSNSSWVDCVEK